MSVLGKYAKAGPFAVEVLACIRFAWGRTDNAIQKRIGCNWRAVSDVTKRLHAAGLIHVGAWERNGTRLCPEWRIGAGIDVEPPAGRWPWGRKRRIGSETLAFCALWSELEQPSSTAELSDASGYGRVTIYRILNHARDLRLVRIAGWQTAPKGGAREPLYALGSQADAPKPRTKTSTECSREYRRAAAARAMNNQVHNALFSTACREPANDQLEAA